PLRRPSGRLVYGTPYLSAREVSLQPARASRAARQLVDGRTTADACGGSPTRFRRAGRSAKPRVGNFESAGTSSVLHARDFGRIHCPLLDGCSLPDADALPSARQIQLQGFEGNAMKLFAWYRALTVVGLSALGAAPQFAAEPRH